METFMITVLLALLGFANAYFVIAITMRVHKSVEDRVKAILRNIYLDSALIIFFAVLGHVSALAVMLSFKYLFFAVVDFRRTLER